MVEFVRPNGGQVGRGLSRDDGGSEERIDEARVDDDAADAAAENAADSERRLLWRTSRLLFLGDEHSHRLDIGEGKRFISGESLSYFFFVSQTDGFEISSLVGLSP